MMSTPQHNLTAFLSDDSFRNHDTGPAHPENRHRYDAVMAAFEESSFFEELIRIAPHDARPEQILRCHTEAYFETARRDIRQGLRLISTGDTHVSSESFDVALRAAGAGTAAVDLVAEGKIHNAFCLVRPPGHHATMDKGMGFCIFNNAAVAARQAQAHEGIDRVLIVDWDVHHGNGTQDIFYHDGSVYYFSIHQHPWFPGTGMHSEAGVDRGRGTTLNCPLPAGSGRTEVMKAFREELLPAMQMFRPDFVIISAGFDSRIEDPLGQFHLTDADFAELTRMMMDLAFLYAGGRLVSILEGGYNPQGLALAVREHVQTLHEYRPETT